MYPKWFGKKEGPQTGLGPNIVFKHPLMIVLCKTKGTNSAARIKLERLSSGERQENPHREKEKLRAFIVKNDIKTGSLARITHTWNRWGTNRSEANSVSEGIT